MVILLGIHTAGTAVTISKTRMSDETPNVILSAVFNHSLLFSAKEMNTSFYQHYHIVYVYIYIYLELHDIIISSHFMCYCD